MAKKPVLGVSSSKSISSTSPPAILLLRCLYVKYNVKSLAKLTLSPNFTKFGHKSFSTPTLTIGDVGTRTGLSSCNLLNSFLLMVSLSSPIPNSLNRLSLYFSSVKVCSNHLSKASTRF